MIEPPEGIEIVLRSLKPGAPPFHRHIVRKKLLGAECCAGEQWVIYEIIETTPPGPVRVTVDTTFCFK